MAADDRTTANADPRSLLIVGNPAEGHVGRHLEQGARSMNVSVTMCDTSGAYAAPAPVRVFNWRLRGRRPSRLTAFSRHVIAECERRRPTHLIATGLAPIDAAALRTIGRLGIRRVNFLTDDPWNPAHRAPWFMESLPEYDDVCTPRSANMNDLRSAGCRGVRYVPFGYAPDVHYPDPPATTEERERFKADVVFIGGADDDRLRWITPLVRAGFRVALYGGYWDRHASTRSAALGMADSWTVRKAIGGAAAALCLVRRANRDGNSMRTFEVPAIGACMLAEATDEHREIFGQRGAAVEYVRNPDDACDRLRALVADAAERRRLSDAAHTLIRSGRHTWQDRLTTMLSVA